jgi:hypothetical protein
MIFGGRLILGTERTKPRIGGRYTAAWVGDVLYEDQPFVVLREATYDEWAAERIEQGDEPKPGCDPSEALFYEVSVDLN